jgi:protein tyrosine phosphatase (PTP) superfamily phosphohydrolase (DUF442 family)
MSEARVSDIVNYRLADEGDATAGQPSEAQLGAAAREGFGVVINLALHDDPRYSLRDERAAVEALGMRYVHIPVTFAAPTRADMLAFFAAMDEYRDRRRLIHCAKNMRVTAFLGLYRVLRRGWPRERAFALMRSVWEPDAVWSAFIESMLGNELPAPEEAPPD